MVMRNWPSVTNFDDGRADHPREPADGTAKIMANLQEIRDAAPTKGNNSYLDKIAAELKRSAPGTEFSWNEKDVVLYSKRNLPLFSELD
jgi:multifunctional beta-oxidation protein